MDLVEVLVQLWMMQYPRYADMTTNPPASVARSPVAIVKPNLLKDDETEGVPDSGGERR